MGSPLQTILNSRLAKRQLVHILLFSSIVTLIGTGIQLFIEYREDMDFLDTQFAQIEKSHLESLTNSLWMLDNRQIEIQLENILTLQDIVFLQITEKGKTLFAAGQRTGEQEKNITLAMVHHRKGKAITIGQLEVRASLGNVYRRLFRRVFIVLVTQGLKTFLVSFFILFILYRQVIRHLISLSVFAGESTLNTLETDFALPRPPNHPPDELDRLVDEFNRMQKRLLTDLNRIKTAETALRKSEEELTAIFQATPDPMIRYDTRFRPLYVNPEFTKLFGWTPAELGEELTSFVPELLTPEREEKIEELHQTGGPVKFASKRRTRSGETVDVIISAALIQNATGMVVNYTDIREQKRLESQLQQSRKMESVGRLAGGVAHDFNNMLSIIMGHTEIILSDLPRENEFSRSVQEIQQAALRSADLVRQLLAFARKQTISPRVLDLNRTTEGMLTMLRRLIGEGISLSWLPAQDLWTVKMDPSQIDQILVNLCVNARDAMAGGGGRITIETRNITLDKAYSREQPEISPGDYVMMAVSDNGCGMDNATMEKLFDPFFTTKEVGQGTGLGLATIYGIVRQNNGLINVYSEPGRGSTFRLYLPRHQAQTVNETGQAAPPEVLGGRETILLVEDERSMLRITTTMLERKGYRVLAASSPGDALTIAGENGPIDLLITDVVMPDMNGRELASAIRRIFPRIRCLYMSGYTANIIAHHGILDENVSFISKPFSTEEIAAKVRRVLDTGL